MPALLVQESGGLCERHSRLDPHIAERSVVFLDAVHPPEIEEHTLVPGRTPGPEAEVPPAAHGVDLQAVLARDGEALTHGVLGLRPHHNGHGAATAKGLPV